MRLLCSYQPRLRESRVVSQAASRVDRIYFIETLKFFNFNYTPTLYIVLIYTEFALYWLLFFSFSYNSRSIIHF